MVFSVGLVATTEIAKIGYGRQRIGEKELVGRHSVNAPQIFREEGVIGTSSIKCQAFLRVLFTLRGKQCELFYC